ncbi:hypothetical protein B0A52_01253 [Exophiala mesophila]|uniref:Uncharacterized protein n=1 Tax=Exophiala mesophila TaxID=212818 RepID=A0A438NGZ0_EXOME|nr:hypothetical protein B0A52_01253 [Exophiala mesophila]
MAHLMTPPVIGAIAIAGVAGAGAFILLAAWLVSMTIRCRRRKEGKEVDAEIAHKTIQDVDSSLGEDKLRMTDG